MEIGYKLILASASPRRRELLAGLDLPFEVRVADRVDESYPAGLEESDVPLFISRKKSETYLESMADDEIVITADTVIIAGKRILGKPSDREEAAEMLRLLSGRQHQVVTGVTLAAKGRTHSFKVTTDVWFSVLTDSEIDYYIERYRPFDKAGAYGIQEWIGYVGIERIDGSYFNVVGLPVQRLYRELLSFVSSLKADPDTL